MLSLSIISGLYNFFLSPTAKTTIAPRTDEGNYENLYWKEMKWVILLCSCDAIFLENNNNNTFISPLHTHTNIDIEKNYIFICT